MRADRRIMRVTFDHLRIAQAQNALLRVAAHCRRRPAGRLPRHRATGGRKPC
jgi:hypothetical protein